MKSPKEKHIIDMSYDTKYRKRAIEYHKEGNSIRKTSEIFGISTNTLNKWLKQHRETGELERKYRTYKTAINEDELLSYLKTNPCAYQSEIGEHFGCHQSVVCRTMKRLNITRKKR
jgi:transposase